MKVLGICGSPRKGNTEWMLERLLKEVAESGIETELILLRKMDIKGCDGCLSCEVGGVKRKGICKIKDDMEQIYPRILAADALALGTPVYFEMLSGLLKNFMDRTCPIWTKLAGKQVVGVAVAEEGIGKAVDNLKTYSSLCSMQWVGSVTALAKKPRQVARDKDVEKQLEKLARKLVNTLKA
ncbi:MAG: iron-sulfur protein [Chloroflexi bacterium RBG_13_50_10]|nr:MAG: iron-sulfur protein [Chloroflexi bacterium RBG_13_50_10]